MDEPARPADPERKPPRFPYAPALLCAACLGAAVWTWMRYSYAWEVTPQELAEADWRANLHPWHDYYVRLQGPVDPRARARGATGVHFVPPGEDRSGVLVSLDRDSPSLQQSLSLAATGGRVRARCDNQMLDVSEPVLRVEVAATASRCHPSSVAGLVVGAMGVFVFALYLRTWVRERREGDKA